MASVLLRPLSNSTMQTQLGRLQRAFSHPMSGRKLVRGVEATAAIKTVATLWSCRTLQWSLRRTVHTRRGASSTYLTVHCTRSPVAGIFPAVLSGFREAVSDRAFESARRGAGSFHKGAARRGLHLVAGSPSTFVVGVHLRTYRTGGIKAKLLPVEGEGNRVEAAGLHTGPVLIVTMPCRCFRPRNRKVSPNRRFDVPEITLIAASSPSTWPGSSAGTSITSQNANQSGAAGSSNNPPGVPIQADLANGSTAPDATNTSGGSATLNSSPADDNSDLDGPRGAFGLPKEDSCEIPLHKGSEAKAAEETQKPTLGEPENALNDLEGIAFTRSTFGRFNVYSCVHDDDEERDVTATSKRPLVIMIPWLNAQTRHVQKYNRLYLQQGIDVLHLSVTPMQILRPLRIKEILGELIEMLKDKEGQFADRPIIIHGFSIGAFVWGQMLVEMAARGRNGDDYDISGGGGDISGDFSLLTSKARDEDSNTPASTQGTSTDSSHTSSAEDFFVASAGHQDKLPNDNEMAGNQTKQAKTTTTKEKTVKASKKTKSSMTSSLSKKTKTSKTPALPKVTTNDEDQLRFLGVVMDSPTPVNHMLDGIPSSVSDNALVKATIRGLLSSYFRLFPRSVHSHYVAGEEAAITNPKGLPVLMLYSSADIIVPSTAIDAVVAQWVERGVQVQVRKWEDSPHVAHFKYHPEQYQKELDRFLEQLRPAASLAKPDPSSTPSEACET